MADFDAPVLALAFGEATPPPPYSRLGPGTEYQRTLGYGWLPSADDSLPTPEETAYGGAAAIDAQKRHVFGLTQPWWPWRDVELPGALKQAIVSGRGQRLRLDLADGWYRFALVATNAVYLHRNHLVSGMVFADDRPVLLDVPLERGALVRREFVAPVRGGAIELRFGGPTGFGVASLLVDRASVPAPDPLETGGVRAWSVSPLHPNPDWIELRDVLVPAPEPGREVRAAAEGLPLVDLGTLAQAEIGDVAVARATLERARAGRARLSVGASSAAHVYVNGVRVLELPNVKGVQRDEGLVAVELRAGRNEIALVLERFWERRWMFYASVL
jgi:hypothetical protein